MEVGDWVRVAGQTGSVLCEVLEMEDMGHGEGNERVRICLFGWLTRYYAAKELVVVPASERRYVGISGELPDALRITPKG